MASPRIEDHAVIGDSRSAALISRSGVVDWLCWPRFDSPPIFGALLDPRAGSWSLEPSAPFKASREYVEDTNVLTTRFETDGGVLRVTDFMPAAPAQDVGLTPSHELIRIVACERGSVDVATRCAPIPDFGRGAMKVGRSPNLGLRFELPQGLLTLRSDIPLTLSGGAARATLTLRAGQKRVCALSLSVDWPEAYRPLGRSQECLERTLLWWRRWSARLRYDGPLRPLVSRSALTLRLMLYAPSGAMIAAPTTSLPEKIGGDSNWDYRYCWLRDASMTARALVGLGYVEDAQAFVGWLLHSTRLTRPALRVLYDVYGNTPQRERIIPHVSGYLDSRPVRTGNAAVGQLQLDIYGEVVGAAATLILATGQADRETQKALRGFGDYVCRHWRQPDEGIWEPRTGRHHRTHSKALCWTALNRLLELDGRGLLGRADAARFADVRRQIRRDVEQRGWDAQLNSYVAVYGEAELDASLLLLAWHGFEHASSPRMLATYSRIRDRLDAGRGLLYRNETQKLGGEGAFGICGFWAADYLALGGGSARSARELLETLAATANDVGLFAEETDPATGGALGNFPQAFTHVGLINAALSLDRRLKTGEEAARA